jgi:hypothetical protein
LKNLIVYYELKFQQFQNEHDSLLLNTTITSSTKTTSYDESKKLSKMSTLTNEDYVLEDTSSTSTTSSSSNESLEFENEYTFKSNDSNHLTQLNKSYNNIYELKMQDSLSKEIQSPSILKSNKDNNTSKNKNKKNKKRVKLDIIAQKKETCDKSTATIHEVATQTEKERSNMGTNTDDNQHHSNHNLLLQLNQQNKSLPKQSAAKSNTDQSNLNNNNLSPNNSKSKGSNKSSSPNLEYLDRAQIDGKQYLLETYLRNNEVTSASTSSSGPLLSKKSSNIMQISNTRESGIGTMNDDECEMESLHSFDENLTDLTDNNNKNTKNELDDEHENSSINVRTCHSNVKLRRKPKLIKSKHQKIKDGLKLNIINDDNYDLIEDIKSKESFDEIENAMRDNDAVKLTKQKSTASNLSDFFKKLCTFILLIFPFLFLFFVYYVYNYYLNPSCCDFKRNYLLINIT